MSLPNSIAVQGLANELQTRLQTIRDTYANSGATDAAAAYGAQQEFALMQTPLKVLDNTLANTKDLVDGD